MDNLKAFNDLVFHLANIPILAVLYGLAFMMRKTPCIPNELIGWINALFGCGLGWLYLPSARPEVGEPLATMVGFTCAMVATFGYELLKGMQVFLGSFLQSRKGGGHGGGHHPKKKPCKLMLAYACAIPLVFGGCATSTTPGGAPPDQTAKIEQFIETNQEIIDVALDVVRQLVISQVEKDPAKKAKLEAKLAALAATIDGMIKRGDFSPATLRAAFQIKEPEIDVYLALVPTAYSQISKQTKNPKLLADILHTIAEGLR